MLQTKISLFVGEKATNNAAEIQAVIRAVETGRDNAVSKLKIKTDSQFLINCVTKWMPRYGRTLTDFFMLQFSVAKVSQNQNPSHASETGA